MSYNTSLYTEGFIRQRDISELRALYRHRSCKVYNSLRNRRSHCANYTKRKYEYFIMQNIGLGIKIKKCWYVDKDECPVGFKL